MPTNMRSAAAFRAAVSSSAVAAMCCVRRPSTFPRLVPAAAASSGSTVVVRCRSVRRALAPVPVRSATAAARELSLKKVIIPPAAGIFSAFGLLYSNLEHHFTQTMLGRIEAIQSAVVAARWAHLEEEAIQIIGREGFAPERCRLQRYGALRYFGQTHELSIPWPAGPVDRGVLTRMAEMFEDSHHR